MTHLHFNAGIDQHYPAKLRVRQIRNVLIFFALSLGAWYMIVKIVIMAWAMLTQ